MSFTNPLDTLFNTSPNEQPEVIEYETTTEGALVEAEPITEDDSDLEIDAKFDQIFDIAISSFTDQTAYQEIIESRYAARNAEVAAAYLNIALSAVTNKAKVKTDRKKNAIAGLTATKPSNQSVVVASREEIMKMISTS